MVWGEHKDKKTMGFVQQSWLCLHLFTSTVSMWIVNPVCMQLHMEMMKTLLLLVVWHQNVASLKSGAPVFPLASDDVIGYG